MSCPLTPELTTIAFLPTRAVPLVVGGLQHHAAESIKPGHLRAEGLGQQARRDDEALRWSVDGAVGAGDVERPGAEPRNWR